MLRCCMSLQVSSNRGVGGRTLGGSSSLTHLEIWCGLARVCFYKLARFMGFTLGAGPFRVLFACFACSVRSLLHVFAYCLDQPLCTLPASTCAVPCFARGKSVSACSTPPQKKLGRSMWNLHPCSRALLAGACSRGIHGSIMDVPCEALNDLGAGCTQTPKQTNKLTNMRKKP